MKPARTISRIAVVLALSVLFVCTIKNDNGALAPTGPNTPQGPGTQTPPTPPVLIVTPDSTYVGVRETLKVAISVMKDSALTKPYPNIRVICSTSAGWVSPETLFTDAKGRAIVKVYDTTKTRVDLHVACGNVEQTVHIDITDTPEKIQKQIQIAPAKAILKADGKDQTAVVVTLMDENHNPVVGQCIQFMTSSGLIVGGGKCANSGQSATDDLGKAAAVLTSANVNDTAYVTAFLAADRSRSVQTKVVFAGVNILLSADSTNLKPGRQAVLTAYLLNGSGEPIPYSPIFFFFGKDSSSNLTFISKDTVTGPQGNAQCIVQGKTIGTDSVRVSAAGAASSLRLNVTDLSLTVLLDDRVLQARESKSTVLHVTFSNNSGAALASKAVQVKRTYQLQNGKDTSDFILSQTDAQGKCAITIAALPYECTMTLEVTAFNTTTDLASASTSLSFITTRTMTINAIPAVIQADGTSYSTITVQVKNEDNNPMVGDKVTFTTDAGLVTASATTDANGRAVATLTSDRRNTITTVKAVLAKDETKFVTIKVEFAGVELTASANPPSINSSGRDSSTITITLVDAAKNPIVGEPINFSKQQDSTHLARLDSVTNNRGEARCKVYGKGTGTDTIRVEAAGATAKTTINYSSNYLVIDTAAGQWCIADGKDSTLINITYLKGDRITPIDTALLDVSVTLGKMNNDTVFAKRMRLISGRLSFYMKNPTFANTATIFVYAKTGLEMTSAYFYLYFKANVIKRIDLVGTPEVIATNGSKAKITAIVYDSLGNRVKDQRISFNMSNGPGGGEYLDPPTALTAEDGSAITYLVSGKTPSMFRQVWITAGDQFGIKSDTIKFTLAGPPNAITVRQNIKEGIDNKDGTFALPCAAIVTDVNGNPVADGTEVTFSCKITGWCVPRPVTHFMRNTNGDWCYDIIIDTMLTIYPFEDLNDNYRLDPGEDINGDGVASRGEDRDGDGQFITGPAYIDINGNGHRDYSRNQPGLAYEPPEPWDTCFAGYDTAGHRMFSMHWADYNGNGVFDTVEPLVNSTMTDSEYTDSLKRYRNNHHDMNFDYDAYPKNGVADPRTTVAIARTVQTTGGKAPNKILYGQADAVRVQVMIWAESQGVKTESPAQFILPIIQ